MKLNSFQGLFGIRTSLDMDYDNDNRILIFQILGPVLCTEPSWPLIHLVFLECLSITGHQRPWCQQLNAWLIHILHHTRCKQLESLYIRARFSRKQCRVWLCTMNIVIKNTKEKKCGKCLMRTTSLCKYRYAPPRPNSQKTILVFYTCSFWLPAGWIQSHEASSLVHPGIP